LKLRKNWLKISGKREFLAAGQKVFWSFFAAQKMEILNFKVSGGGSGPINFGASPNPHFD
jgi:hypothetical protein